MVQVRDNGKVCRLAVPPGVFALPNRCVGKSQFGNRVQTPGGTPRRAVTIHATTTTRRPRISPVLTLNGVERHSQSRCGIAPANAGVASNHGGSRWITVNHASFSRITHQPLPGAGKVNLGKSRLIPVNPASQFFRLPEMSPPLPPPSRRSRFRVRGIARMVAAAAASNRTQSQWIAVNRTQNFSTSRGWLLRNSIPGYQ